MENKNPKEKEDHLLQPYHSHPQGTHPCQPHPQCPKNQHNLPLQKKNDPPLEAKPKQGATTKPTFPSKPSFSPLSSTIEVEEDSSNSHTEPLTGTTEVEEDTSKEDPTARKD
jgi:hypothetical protein